MKLSQRMGNRNTSARASAAGKSLSEFVVKTQITLFRAWGEAGE